MRRYVLYRVPILVYLAMVATKDKVVVGVTTFQSCLQTAEQCQSDFLDCIQCITRTPRTQPPRVVLVQGRVLPDQNAGGLPEKVPVIEADNNTKSWFCVGESISVQGKHETNHEITQTHCPTVFGEH